MRAYTEPIMTAVWAFPFVAAMIILPYMLFQYRRYGAILLLRTAILFSFILYLMCAYFLTMLPIPSRDEVASLTTPYLQLTPFQDVAVWVARSGFVLQSPATWKALFLSRDFFVLAANVVMTVPFGIYLRYYFGFSLRKTLAFSLGLSLLFELTQLSALFGLYPRPYRLCETDDLITNTLGGVIGYWIAGPLMHMLPTRERMDAVAYRRGTHVSVTRRVTAAAVDWFIIGTALSVLLMFSQPLRTLAVSSGYAIGFTTLSLLYLSAVTLYFVLGEWLQKGLTVGKRLTHLRLVDERNLSSPKLWQCVVRYGVLYVVFVPLPVASMAVFGFAMVQDAPNIPLLILCIVLLLIFAAGMLLTLMAVINRSNQLPHGALSKTRNVSTLLLDESMLYRVGQNRNEQFAPCPPPEAPGPMLND